MNRRAVGLLVIFLLFGAVLTAQAAVESQLRAVFINVGQGDAALLQDETGFTVLIDGGKASSADVLLETLRRFQVEAIDVMVASHSHEDHIGGLIEVLQSAQIPVHAILYNGCSQDTQTWNDLVASAGQAGLTLEAVHFPQTLTWGHMTAHILHPAEGQSCSDPNDASLVIRLDYGPEVNLLFTGDISEKIEATVAARGTPLASEILKVAHHGSDGSSNASFLATVQPQQALISVGVNSYGHPGEGTLARLATAGAHSWRTDLSGTVWFSSNGLSIQVHPEINRLYLPVILTR
jgi:competence protein ComEC